MKFKLILLIVLFNAKCYAQRYWADGTLSWNDFTVREYNYNDNISELQYYLGFSSEKDKWGDTVLVYYKAKCYMDQKLSWVRMDYKTNTVLLYNQVLFNIVEVHRRLLQVELYRQKNIEDMKYKLNAYLSVCQNSVNQYQFEAKRGGDFDAIMRWNDSINKILMTNNEIENAIYKLGDFTYGVGGGAGIGILTKSISNYFTNSAGLCYGFDVGYRKTELTIFGFLGNGKVKDNNVNLPQWPKGNKTGLTNVNLSLQHSIVESRKINCGPILGIGVSEISLTKNTNVAGNTRVDPLESYTWNTGFFVTYKFKKIFNHVNKSIITKKGSYTERCVRLRFVVSPNKFGNGLSGLNYTTSLVYLIKGRSLSIVE